MGAKGYPDMLSLEYSLGSVGTKGGVLDGFGPEVLEGSVGFAVGGLEGILGAVGPGVPLLVEEEMVVDSAVAVTYTVLMTV